MMRIPKQLVLGWLALLALSLVVGCGDDESQATTRTYNIALGDDFPPYDVSTMNGTNHDILLAICAANAEMECNIIDAPYADCFDADASGAQILGPKLLDGTFDGCMGWYITQDRIDLGITFSEDYAAGVPTNLIANADATPATGTDLGGATVGFLAGFFNDEACLSRYYTNFESEFYSGDTQRADLLAALDDGTIDYVFWDAAPPIDPPAGTVYVGDAIGDCPAHGVAMAAYGDKAADLASDFNTGLNAIRADGTLEQICDDAITAYNAGDPNCLFE